MPLLPLLAGSFLGWALGANDAANVFGTAVTTRMVRFLTAAVLCGAFVLLGAWLQGSAGIHTLDSITTHTTLTAGLTALAAALTVTAMTLLRLPISTSQAVVGAIIGVGLMKGGVDLQPLKKVVLCWLGTPIGAMLVAMLLYPPAAWLYNRAQLGLYRQDALLRAGLVMAGCYGAYALGANNVGNVGALYVAAGIAPDTAALLGGGCIALGVLTFSRRVMDTVGKGIVKLDAFASLIVVTSEAITVHAYAMVGVPVSTSQAVIGAVLGVGLIRSTRSVRLKPVRNVVVGWLLTPAVACLLSVGLWVACHLRYVG